MKLQRTPFGLRTPKEVQDWVKAKAAESDRSQNYVINKILRNAMESEQATA